MKHQERIDQGAVIIELEGEADLATVPAFQDTMRAKMKEKLPHLVIDFSNVTFVNTPIWAVVVEYYQHTHKAKSAFALAGLKDRVEASFNIVRLGEFIPHFATVEEALQSGSSNTTPPA